MGEMIDKAKGAANEVIGNAKQAAATKGSRLDAEGKAQETKGEAQQVKGTIKGKLGDDI